jgi:hypothetical protein
MLERCAVNPAKLAQLRDRVQSRIRSVLPARCDAMPPGAMSGRVYCTRRSTRREHGPRAIVPHRGGSGRNALYPQTLFVAPPGRCSREAT